ncbi:acyl carrier protein [Streptomyces sp. NPDC047000]|uniref:acyl carrier protein n=1 Tax=Streptomyces sp. NPDC047000 TaxID=3155474 RepID=UPI0033DFC3F0
MHRLDRQDVLELLATFRERTAQDLDERIDSMELAWLLNQVEQRHGAELDLGDDELSRMTTVPAAVEVLRGALERSARG